MATARLKPHIFDKCDSTIIVKPGRASTYAGFNHNPELPCKLTMRDTQVCINGNWWSIDPSEWIIDDKECRHPEMYELKTGRKYNKITHKWKNV